MRGWRSLTLLFSLLLALFPFLSDAQLFSISDDEVIEAGRQAHDEIMKQYGVWEDPAQQARIERLGANLTRFSQRPDVRYEFYLLDSNILNAFATPDGSVHVTRGLATAFSDNEM